MLLTIDDTDWNSEDIVVWRQFLKTKTGSKLLPKLAESLPSLLGEGDPNKILIRTGEVRGWQDVISHLLALTHEPMVVEQDKPTAYPPLDKNEAWDDEEKV